MSSKVFDSAAGEMLLSNRALLNVVLAYEDFPAGLHALRTFDRLYPDGQERAEFDTHNVWKFDLLGMDKLREIAAQEAARADMVIISAHGPNDLPPSVKLWMTAWMKLRQRRPGALVAMLGGAAGHLPGRFAVEPYLETCALRAGMDYLIQKVPGRHGLEKSDFGRNTNKDWQAFDLLTQVRRGVSGVPHWGLNE